MQDPTGALSDAGCRDPIGRDDNVCIVDTTTPDERPHGLAEVAAGKRAGGCCQDAGSRAGHRDVGFSLAKRSVPGSGG
jgi:hypothetical protein